MICGTNWSIWKQDDDYSYTLLVFADTTIYRQFNYETWEWNCSVSTLSWFAYTTESEHNTFAIQMLVVRLISSHRNNHVLISSHFLSIAGIYFHLCLKPLSNRRLTKTTIHLWYNFFYGLWYWSNRKQVDDTYTFFVCTKLYLQFYYECES